MPTAVQAGFWGLLAGSALILGAAVAYFASIPQRLIAFIMSFGSGVLISALAFDLMDEAYRRGGFDSTSLGFLGGATVYTAANIYLSRRGAKHPKTLGRPAAFRFRQRAGDRDRRSARWHPRVDRDRREHDRRRGGQLGGGDRDLSVECA